MRTTIREATVEDAAAIAEAHVATWRETYRGLLPDSYLAGLTPAGRQPQWQRILDLPNEQRSVLVAEGAGGEIAGFASGGPHYGAAEWTGEIYTLYLRRAYHGCGLGRGLFTALVARLREQEMDSLILWVLATNEHARGFYAAMGGQPLREQEIVIDGIPLCEIGYGWRDISAIGQRPESSDDR